jgi:predicted permease
VLEILLSISTIYFFILIGYFLKLSLKEKIDEKTLTYVSVYGTQPILVFWGLNLNKIDESLFYVPVYYWIIIFSVFILFLVFSKIFYKDEKNIAISSTMPLIGNTGNLGIPLGIAIFGEISVPYTSIINIANIFFIYTISVFMLARNSYSLKNAIFSIMKIPILWVAIFSIWFNLNGFEVSDEVMNGLKMGAYTSIVIQLMIFGIYLFNVKIKTIDYKLNIILNLKKLFILPLIGFFIISELDLLNFIGAVIFMELLMPLAVNNVNMASLYNNYPEKVTLAVFTSSFIFIFIISFYIEFLNLNFLF